MMSSIDAGFIGRPFWGV